LILGEIFFKPLNFKAMKKFLMLVILGLTTAIFVFAKAETVQLVMNKGSCTNVQPTTVAVLSNANNNAMSTAGEVNLSPRNYSSNNTNLVVRGTVAVMENNSMNWMSARKERQRQQSSSNTNNVAVLNNTLTCMPLITNLVWQKQDSHFSICLTNGPDLQIARIQEGSSDIVIWGTSAFAMVNNFMGSQNATEPWRKTSVVLKTELTRMNFSFVNRSLLTVKEPGVVLKTERICNVNTMNMGTAGFIRASQNTSSGSNQEKNKQAKSI